MFVKRWQGLPAKCQRRVLITSRISLLNAGRRGQAVRILLSFFSYFFSLGHGRIYWNFMVSLIPKEERIIFQQLIFQELSPVSFRFQLLWLVRLPPLTWLIHQVVSLKIFIRPYLTFISGRGRGYVTGAWLISHKDMICPSSLVNFFSHRGLPSLEGMNGCLDLKMPPKGKGNAWTRTITESRFQFFYMFAPELWGRFPFWQACFSNGLKPPIRSFFAASMLTFGGASF